MVYIRVKNYNDPKTNINRTLGVHIKNRTHYEKVMKEKGFVDWDTGCALAAKAREEKPLSDLPKEDWEFIKQAKLKADKNGNVKWGDREIKYMLDKGIAQKRRPELDKLPKAYQGGFNDGV